MECEAVNSKQTQKKKKKYARCHQEMTSIFEWINVQQMCSMFSANDIVMFDSV